MLGKIMELAHKVNTKKRATVFVEYLGHVNLLNVRVFVNGWNEDAEPNIRREAYMDDAELQDIYLMLENLERNEPMTIKIGRCEFCMGDIMDGDKFMKVKSKMFCASCSDELKGAL